MKTGPVVNPCEGCGRRSVTVETGPGFARWDCAWCGWLYWRPIDETRR